MKARFFKQKLLWMLTFILLSTANSYAQDLNVKGRVVDETGMGIIGAAVQLKGSANGVVTDIDGNFAITVPEGSVLVFSYVSYVTQELKAAPQMTVVMKENVELLEEVVVVGYGVQKKSNVTGAISKVEESDLSNRTVTSAVNALGGKTSGLQLLSASAAPGASPVIRVRGYSSNYSSEPLYIVDGLKVNSINNIDPDEIESMEVLKDAASAAIYGSEAGNGVVLISTKKAQEGKTSISYDFQFASQSVNRIPKVLNAQEYIQFYREGGFITDEKINVLYDGKTDTNWGDVAFENGSMMKHSVALKHGTQKSNLMISLNYLNNNGIAAGNKDSFQRYNLNMNAELKPSKWLTFGVNSTVSYSKMKSVNANNGGIGGGIMTAVLELDPLTPIFYDTANLPAFINDLLKEGRHLLTDETGKYYGISQFYQSGQINPLELIAIHDSNNTSKSIRANVYANFMPINGLTVTSRFGFNFNDMYSHSYSRAYYCHNWAESAKPTITQSSPQTNYWQWENFANYLKSIGKHNLNVMAGISFSENTNQSLSSSIDQILRDQDSYAWIDFATGNATKTIRGIENTTRKFSYFGRLNYDYDNRYIAEFSLRADAADLSILPKAERWGYFPAGSLGWIISNESFFPKNNTITYLKLRGSWGQNGSIANLSNYTYASAIVSNAKYPFGTGTYQSGSYPSSLGNPHLKWETSEQTDFGIDARFFDSRLSLSVDYYLKKTKDLIINGSTPSLTAGNSPSPINAGNVENKGFEFDFSWKDRINQLSYGISANLSTLKNKVTYLDPTIERLSGSRGPIGADGAGSFFEVGYPVWYLRGFHVESIDSKTGNPQFEDLNTDGVIDANDVKMIGSGIPDVNYGITLNMAYKGFDLILFGSGAIGNDIWYAATFNNVTGANTLKYFYDDRWTPTNTNATIARPLCNEVNKYYASDAYLFDGSYFKIKQIQVGYTFPKKVTGNLHIQNVRAYVSLDDFFTFTSYPGLDPEAASLNTSNGIGIDTGNYPQSKKLVFGLNVTF